MTNAPRPRVAAIHDLSGFGKCSLTVALPVLSACGIETCCLPTAILSTHTGGLTGYTYRDLTGDMRAFYQHWQSLELTFEAVYTGFLSSPEQIDIVREAAATLKKPGAPVLVDPVMGDHGKLYRVFTPAMVDAMRALCQSATVLVPNLTEAAFLLCEPLLSGPRDAADYEALCRRLQALGPERIVLTGVSLAPELLGACCLDGREFSIHMTPRVPGAYHGTGDVYASVLLGALLRGRTLARATALAADFTRACIARTYARGTDPRYGVDFETGLSGLRDFVGG